MLPALAFVPTGDVWRTFCQMRRGPLKSLPTLSNITSERQDEISGQRRTPMFPIPLWNVYECSLGGEDRTNNAHGGWQRRFTSVVSCRHPTIWKVIGDFVQEQSSTEREGGRLLAGYGAAKRKKKYANCDRRLRTLLHSFEVRPPLNSSEELHTT